MDNLEVRHDRRPLYLIVKDKLREWVDSGVFKPGSKLPREVELAHRMKVSRSTLREAIGIAKQEGWIIQKHGLGTFVSQSGVTEKGLESLESISVLCKRRGWECSSTNVVIEEREPEPKVAETLQLSSGVNINFVARVMLVNNEPAAYIEDYVPTHIISLEDLQTSFTGSVLEIIRDIGKPMIDYAWTNVIACTVDDRLSPLLKSPVGNNVLLAEEILFSPEGQPFEYSLNYMLSDKFNFHIIRTLSG